MQEAKKKKKKVMRRENMKQKTIKKRTQSFENWSKISGLKRSTKIQIQYMKNTHTSGLDCKISES